MPPPSVRKPSSAQAGALLCQGRGVYALFPAGRGTACRGWLIPAALFPQAEMLLSIYTAGVVALGCQVESLQI